MSLFKSELPLLSPDTAILEQVGIEVAKGCKIIGRWAEVVGVTNAAAAVNQYAYRALYPVEVVSFDVIYATASSSGTIMLEHETSAQAITAGTNVLTGTVSLSTTAATVNKGTLASAPATLQLASGDTLGLIFAGTQTNLAGALVTIQLKRI